MNSTKDPSNPPPQPSQTELTKQEREELIALRNQKSALSMMLWETVRAANPETHEMEVPANPSDPLWQIAFVRSSDPKSPNVRILAGTIPPITEQEKKRVVRMLRGTAKPMHEALAELKLPHPPSYVENAIKEHLQWDTEKMGWESPKAAGVVERVKNFVGVAK